MATGFEDSSVETLTALVNNLKSGAFNALSKMDSAAFELDLTILFMLETEFLSRNLDFDSLVGAELRAIIDMWKNERVQ